MGNLLARLARRRNHRTISHSAYARIGLLGNPSDGYNGKTLSILIKNYHATVTLKPLRSPTITFHPHVSHDRLQYDSLADAATKCDAEGYYGGVRLLKAATHAFFDFWRQRGVNLASQDWIPGFTLSYDTTIPRQSGLSGSSAIIWATLQCLFEHYSLPLHANDCNQCPQYRDVAPVKEELPSLVLSVERRLGIAAGLQDRVIQVYGGVVHMDFHKSIMDAPPANAGKYTPLSSSQLPPLRLLVAQAPSDSGRVHSDLRQRYDNGDADVHAAMKEVAGLADDGRALLTSSSTTTSSSSSSSSWPALFRRNFALRRKMFGDDALGEQNLRMVEIAEAHGFAAKFSGSGGACVATPDVSLMPGGDVEAAEQRLVKACADENIEVHVVQVHQHDNTDDE
ncbi:glucuronokinase [Pycnococcus provasolii]